MIGLIIVYGFMVLVYILWCGYDMKRYKEIQPDTMTLGVITMVIGIGILCMNLMIR